MKFEASLCPGVYDARIESAEIRQSDSNPEVYILAVGWRIGSQLFEDRFTLTTRAAWRVSQLLAGLGLDSWDTDDGTDKLIGLRSIITLNRDDQGYLRVISNGYARAQA